MGEDLVTIVLTIEKGIKPNWKKGLNAIQKLEITPLPEWPKGYLDRQMGDSISESPDEKELTDQVSTLKNDLETLKAAWANKRHDGNKLEICHKILILSAGMSWGDPPTELYESMDRLIDAGATKAMGFDW